MKKHRSILWFSAIIAVLIALALWHWKREPLETPLPTSTEANDTPPATTTPNGSEVRVSASSQVTGNTAKIAASQTIPATSQDKISLLKQILQGNDVSIVFHGLLEDQFGTVVSGAKVNFSIQYEDANAMGIHRGQVISDGNGFFTISGTGATLGIMPEKMGYALATTDTSFRYSQLTPGYFVPNANNPTIVKMWKLQGAEPLVSINQRYKFQYTATPLNFDLLAGKIVPTGGDIQLTVSRSSGIMTGRNRLDWSVQVAAVDGGLMDSGGQERVTCAAPEDGYQPSMAFIFSTNAPYKWAGGFDQGFFATSRNGQVHSKLGLSFRINNMPDGLIYVTFNGVANASGSRNWEMAVPQ